MKRFPQPALDNGPESPHHRDMTVLFWIVILMPAVFGLVSLWVERSRLAR